MAEKKGLYYYVNKRKKAGTSRSKNNPKAPSDADWKNAAKTAKVSEAIVDHASDCDSDHEVQMARADLYNIADKALKLHKILKNISEQEGLQGWQQAKITKAADYMDAVFSSLNYETMSTMSSVQTRPASNGSVGVASVAMSEREVADYKALLEKATTRAKKRVMEMSEDEANEAKWYSGPKPPPRKKPKPKPAASAAPQKKNRLKNIAGAAALAAAGLGAGTTANDYIQNFGNNNTAQATQTQQAADTGGAGLSGSNTKATLDKAFADADGIVAAAGTPGAKATAKNTTGSPAAKLASLPSDAALDAQAAQIEKDFAAKNAKNDASAKAQSSAQRDAAQGKVGGARPSGPAAGMPGMSNAQIAAMIRQQQADREAAIDTDIDNLGGQVQQAGGMVNKFAQGVDSISNTTAADTPPGPAPTVDPTFMPKNTPTFVDAKEKWLATNPTSTQVDRYNEMISFFNKAVANGNGNVRIKAIQGTSKWLRDPNNAGRGSVNSNESKKYRIAENDDDDSSEVGGVATRQASSRGQAIAWRQDADARSASAVEKYPEFFTDEHLDRVDAIYDIIERVLTPSKIYVTHRFGGKEGPFTALAIYDPSWPRTLGVSKSARTREFYSPIEDLGGVYSKPLRSGAPGFIMHVIV